LATQTRKNAATQAKSKKKRSKVQNRELEKHSDETNKQLPVPNATMGARRCHRRQFAASASQ
jgi:hypothetical protein